MLNKSVLVWRLCSCLFYFNNKYEVYATAIKQYGRREDTLLKDINNNKQVVPQVLYEFFFIFLYVCGVWLLGFGGILGGGGFVRMCFFSRNSLYLYSQIL